MISPFYSRPVSLDKDEKNNNSKNNNKFKHNFRIKTEE